MAALNPSGSGGHDEGHVRRLLGRHLTVFELLGDRVKSQRLDLRQGFLPGGPVNMAARDRLNQSDPAPILFPIEINRQSHGERIAQLGSLRMVGGGHKLLTMASRRNPKGPKPVGAIKHKDKRVNKPTEELREFVKSDEEAPRILLYPRDPSLDPQLVWKGKDEQDLEVPVVPVYIQEKIHRRL